MTISLLGFVRPIAAPLLFSSIAIALLFLSPSISYSASIDVYAKYKSVAGRLIPLELGKRVGTELSNHGFTTASTTLISPSISVTPLVKFDQNTNGGNSRKPLILGDMKFVGQPELEKRSGLVAGAVTDMKFRHATGWGKYVDFTASISEAVDVSKLNRIRTNNFKFCSINHIHNWTYLDACYGEASTEKELSSSTNIYKNYKLSKLFQFKTDAYGKIGLGNEFINNGIFEQRVHTIDIETLNAQRRLSLIFKHGDKPRVTNQHALEQSVTISSSFKILQRHGNIAFTAQRFGGSKLLGFDRNDNSQTLILSTNISKHINLEFGYHKNISSIDYYSDEYPILNLNFIN